MTEQLHTPNREEQALLEVGRTDVGRGVAAALVALCLATVAGVPLAQGVLDLREGALFPAGRELLDRRPQLRAAAGRGLFSLNRELEAAIDAFETALEDGSVLRRRLLPPVQQLSSSWLGLGNEQAYVGRGGWLFYRADVDYVTSPGFLEPAVLARRAAAGDAWTAPPQPDPLAALADFERQTAARGVKLLVVPTPVKPVIHPERFSRRGETAAGPVQNLSFDRFLAELEAAGIAAFDPAPLLWQARQEANEPLYLATDTHWTPPALERVARELARRIEALGELPPETAAGYRRRSVVVEHLGDVAAMLRLPADQTLFAPEQVTAAPVLDLRGRAWKSDREAAVLLLGDSFTNIYSDPALGWGAGAGLAEQLSYFLQRPVDRIALNAGGSHASREALARSLAAGDDRLAGKRIVVYQFAVRELAQGDWKLVALDAAPPG